MATEVDDLGNQSKKRPWGRSQDWNNQKANYTRRFGLTAWLAIKLKADK
jgi:hypothetical protein